MGFYREVKTVAHRVLLRLDLRVSIRLNTAAKIPSCHDNIDPCAGVCARTPRQFVFRPLSDVVRMPLQLLHSRSTLFTVASWLRMMRQTFHVMADGYYTL